MTPTFINTNSHYVYVDLPGRDEDLTRVRAFEKIKVSGADADALEETNGVVNLDTAEKDTKAAIEAQLTARELAGIGVDPSPADPDDSDKPKSKAAAKDPGKGGGGTVTTSDVKGDTAKKAPAKAKKRTAKKRAKKAPAKAKK